MNILVTGSFAWSEDDLNRFRGLGHNVAFMQYEADEISCDLKWLEGVIGNGFFLSHRIEQFINLKFIQLTSAGFDRVPMDYINEKGISIFNAKGVYSIPMAEFAVCGVLELYKKSKSFIVNQETHSWKKQRDILELNGKTVCIVGCGSVGTECAKRLRAFGCKVLGVDTVPYKSAYYERILPLSRLDETLSVSDVIILTLPLTDETCNIINRGRIEKIKEDAILVNLARGEVIDSIALVDALDMNLGGAVLDVFIEEPLPDDNPLWDFENVIITPHNSFVGDGNHERMLNLTLKNLETFS